jgi:hypothetical protein
MSDRIAEIENILAGRVQDHAWQGVMIAISYIQYLIFTPRGRVGAAGIVSWVTGALSSVAGVFGPLATGAVSGLSGLVAGTAGVLTKVGTQIMTNISPFLGTVARDEAFKAYNQTKNITVDHANTADVETEKAKKRMFMQIANFCDYYVPGCYDFVFFILMSIPGVIFKTLWNKCCNSEQNKDEAPTEVKPPAAVEENVAVTPTKRTRARNKSPGPPTPKSKSK